MKEILISIAAFLVAVFIGLVLAAVIVTTFILITELSTKPGF